MGSYVVRRITIMIVIFFGVTLIMYAAVYALPGNPIQNLAGAQHFSQATVNELTARYGLDKPFLQQYGTYIDHLLHGNFGTDFNGNSISTLMAQRWPVTIRLALTAWILEVIFGIGLGTLTALLRGKWLDRSVLLVTIAVLSIPIFVFAYTSQLLLGINAGWFPVAGVADGWPRSYLLPAVVLSATSIVVVTRLVRSSVVDNLKAEYVRTAKAKGLGPFRIIVRHVLRNSLIPAVTVLGVDLGFIVSGTVVVEGIFNLPGVGNLLFTSIQQQQGPVVVGVATIMVMVFLAVNLVVDLLYGVIDPRIARA